MYTEHCKEMEMLKAENAQLKRDQEFMFLVMDIGLEAVEQWARENSLLMDEIGRASCRERVSIL